MMLFFPFHCNVESLAADTFCSAGNGGTCFQRFTLFTCSQKEIIRPNCSLSRISLTNSTQNRSLSCYSSLIYILVAYKHKHMRRVAWIPVPHSTRDGISFCCYPSVKTDAEVQLLNRNTCVVSGTSMIEKIRFLTACQSTSKYVLRYHFWRTLLLSFEWSS